MGQAEPVGVVSEEGLDVVGQAAVDALLEVVRDRHGTQIASVLVYGSFLRGKRDTLIDLYVLLNSYDEAMPRRWHGWAGAALPPTVYYLSAPLPSSGGSGTSGTSGKSAEIVRSKCSVMRLDQLEHAVHNDFHPYFWARFCQPFLVAYAADEKTRARSEAIRETAAATFLATVLPELPRQVDSRTAWSTGFRMTYACELRPESQDAAASLYVLNQAYFDGLFAQFEVGRRNCLGSWKLRQWVGKTLGVLRVIKAGATFEDPIDYVVWKTERHSGVHVEPTDRQRRYPLIFGWSLLWQLYRRGAFR